MLKLFLARVCCFVFSSHRRTWSEPRRPCLKSQINKNHRVVRCNRRASDAVASLNRSRASRRPRGSGKTSIRSLVPNTIKLRRQQARLELFKETVHVKVKVTISTPSSPVTVRSQDPERGGHANRSAASDVAGKQLEDDRNRKSLCRTCEMTRR